MQGAQNLAQARTFVARSCTLVPSLSKSDWNSSEYKFLGSQPYSLDITRSQLTMSNCSIPSTPTVPKLVPVFSINLKLEGTPEIVFQDNTKSKVLNHANVLWGEIRTIKNDLGLEFDVLDIHGFDDITTNSTGNYNELDCRLYGKTPSGAGAFVSYYGIFNLTKDITDVLTEQSKEHDFATSSLHNNPRFQLDDSAEDKYKWVQKENLLGRGRFCRSEDNSLHVQYFVYVVR